MKRKQIVTVDNVSKEFHVGSSTVQALKNISLTIEEGDFVAVMGSSGSGKTTLMQVIGTLLSPDQGKLIVAGERTALLDDDALSCFRNETIGFVFQFFHLQAFYSAWENVALPLVFANVALAERRSRSREALCDVGLAGRIDHKPEQMSGGEMQRVAIARAMINEPKLLLADEPTGNLDRDTGKRVLEILSKINKERGVTVILVTHDEKLTEFARRVIRMDNGEVLQ